MSSRLFRFIIWGAPGSGKGTISSRIVNDFRLAYLSVGDLLRDHMARKTVYGLEAEQYITQGKLVPDPLANKLVMDEMKTTFAGKSWLLDGYPRTIVQAEELWSNVKLTAAIRLIVPDDEIIERVKHRWIHLPSGRTYHLIFNPPKTAGLDDITGEKLIQREDDKEAVVIQRLLTYKQQENIIVEFYKNKGLLVEFAGRQSNEIYPKIKLYLSQIIPQQSIVTQKL